MAERKEMKAVAGGHTAIVIMEFESDGKIFK